MPSLRRPQPDAPPPPTLEAILLDDEALDSYLCEIIRTSRSDAARITAEKRLRQVRRERQEAQLSDKAWPVPLTREEYKTRLARILQACGRSLVEETLALPGLWEHDTGL